MHFFIKWEFKNDSEKVVKWKPAADFSYQFRKCSADDINPFCSSQSYIDLFDREINKNKHCTFIILGTYFDFLSTYADSFLLSLLLRFKQWNRFEFSCIIYSQLMIYLESWFLDNFFAFLMIFKNNNVFHFKKWFRRPLIILAHFNFIKKVYY